MATRRTTTIADAIPPHWLDNLVEHMRLGMGFDVATTTNKKSNPSSLAVTEKNGLDYIVRLLIKWKTADPEIAHAIIIHVLDQLATKGRRAVKLCIDASNEKYFAAAERRKLAGRVPVDLVVNSEATQYLGEPMNFKTYLGNLYVNTICDDDGHMLLPDDKWVCEDARQVKRDKGTFVADVDEEGNHADAFDATKLSIHALVGAGGPVDASAMKVGSLGAPIGERPGVRNPYASKFGRNKGVMTNA